MAGGATANATATTTGSGAIRVDLVQATRRVALNSATEVTEVSPTGRPTS